VRRGQYLQGAGSVAAPSHAVQRGLAAYADLGYGDRRLIVPLRQPIRPHDTEPADSTEQHLPFGCRRTRAYPVAGDGPAFGAAEGADGEGLLIDPRQAVVGAQPDVVFRVLEELVGIVVVEALGDTQPPETRLALGVARLENIDSTAEGGNPHASAGIGEYR